MPIAVHTATQCTRALRHFRSAHVLWSTFHFNTVCCSVLQCVAVSCSVLQRIAKYCNVLQCAAVETLVSLVASIRVQWLSCTACPLLYTLHTLQYTATHCNALQRTATHCQTLQMTQAHTTYFDWVICSVWQCTYDVF